jgi:hypothetical protein
MTRGLGSVQMYVLTHLGLTARRPRLLRDVAADLCHERRSFAFPALGLPVTCDCDGRCVLLSAAAVNAVQRAVSALRAKGLVRGELDPYGRLRVSLVSWPPRWEFHPDDQHGPRLCPGCGLRSGSKTMRGEAA